MVMVTEPELSVTADEVKLPLERTTEPVGVPFEPETVIVTPRLWAVVMLPEAGTTVMVGVAAG
jgi:hypothetical protein